MREITKSNLTNLERLLKYEYLFNRAEINEIIESMKSRLRKIESKNNTRCKVYYQKNKESILKRKKQAYEMENRQKRGA